MMMIKKKLISFEKKKVKKKRKDVAKIELRRNGTINIHSFSHLWPAGNKKKREGKFSNFPSSSLNKNT
jgi:hypothetical protein